MRRILMVGKRVEAHILGNGKAILVGDIVFGPTYKRAEVLEIGETCMRVRYLGTGRKMVISNFCITDVEKK